MKRLGLVLMVLFVACGKRGDPRPPVPVIPQAASDLVVTQRGSNVILSWSYPALSTSGQSLGPVRSIVVYRYVEQLPVPVAGRDPATVLPGDIDQTVPEPIALFAKVPALTPAQFTKLRQRVDSIEGANLPGATVGTRLIFEDKPAFRSSDGRPVRITYAIVTEGASAQSEPSNLATIVPVDVPLPPSTLEASADAAGVTLQWSKADRAATSNAKPFLAGYNVYRSRTGETPEEFATPVNTAPVVATTYTDVPPYGTYEYRVSAVAVSAPSRIESTPSTPATVTFKDLVPPPPPATVTALVETNQVRLIWDRVEATDLQGFLIYRTQGPYRLKLTPSPSQPTATNFLDISVERGIEYFYSITSVDKSGNESAPVKSDTIIVPRTP